MSGTWIVNRLPHTERSSAVPRRLSFWLFENCFRSEVVLFKESLLDELFHVPSEGSTIDGLVPFAVVVRSSILPTWEARDCAGLVSGV